MGICKSCIIYKKNLTQTEALDIDLTENLDCKDS